MEEETPRCSGATLCDELEGSTDTSFHLTYQGDPASRIIFRTDRLALIADISPLVLGHLLILPVAHHLSFGHVAESMRTEIRRFLRLVLPLYAGTFGPPLILEHGSSRDMDGKACISHAHWHVVPMSGESVRGIIVNDGLTAHTLTDFTGLAEFARAGTPYFYLTYGRQHHAFSGRRPPRQQYLRSVIAQVLGIPEPSWDYALVVRHELLRATVKATEKWQPALAEVPLTDASLGFPAHGT